MRVGHATHFVLPQKTKRNRLFSESSFGFLVRRNDAFNAVTLRRSTHLLTGLFYLVYF